MWETAKRSLGALFAQDKAPIIITLFFGALTWTVTRTIDQLSAIPVVEYRVTSERISGSTQRDKLIVRLRNVTYTRQFDCFKVILAPQDEATLTFHPTTFRVELMSQHVPNISEKNAIPEQVSAQISRFGPRADIHLIVHGTGNGPVRVATRECQDVDESNKAQTAIPILLPLSLRTILVEWEIEALWVFLFVWALAILAMGRRMEQPAQANRYRRPARWGTEKR